VSYGNREMEAGERTNSLSSKRNTKEV